MLNTRRVSILGSGSIPARLNLSVYLFLSYSPRREANIRKVILNYKTTFQALIIHEVGLHARPAAQFVTRASEFQSLIRLRNLSTNSKWADAKSILGVLTLGVEANHRIEVELEGQDADEAATALKLLIDSNFPLD